MRPLPVVICMLLAGCAGDGEPPAAPLVSSPDVLVAAGPDDCPLTYPDGSPMPCDVQEFVPAASDARPELASGWRCTHVWSEDSVHVESYMDPHGALGFYWEWQRWKEDGLAFQRLGWYEGDGIGESLHVPYQPRGFVSIGPQEPNGDVEIHHSFRQFRAHALVDGEWTHPDNVTFLLDNVGGDTWWVARFDWPGGPYYVSTMHEDREEGRHTVWEGASKWNGTIAGVDVIIDSTGNGIKYVNVDYTSRRATISGCALPDVQP